MWSPELPLCCNSGHTDPFPYRISQTEQGEAERPAANRKLTKIQCDSGNYSGSLVKEKRII